MLTCYITAPEFRSFRNLAQFGTDAEIETALRAATHDLAETLVSRGDDPTLLQPPEMFDSVTAFAEVTKSADHTSATLSAKGGRFVIETTSDTDSATFALEGLSGTSTWIPVLGIDGERITFTVSTKGRYTALINTRFVSYRLKVTTSADVTYRAFITDTGPDKAIRASATVVLLSPFADPDTTIANIVDRAESEYSTAMSALSLLIATGTDTDGDGDIDTVTGTQHVQRYVRLWR